MRTEGPSCPFGPEVSLVIPVYNEAENVGPLWAELARVLPQLGRAEVLFVDDGSTDGTLEALLALKRSGAPLRILKLRRNFGQTAALAAGLDRAQGEIIVTLDGDLQNDPADVPRLVAQVRAGYDLVCGWRRRRRDPWLTRVLPSRVANALIARVTGVRIHDYGCTLKAMRRSLVRHLNLYADQHRFIPALAARHGARIGEVEVAHRPRVRGRSKYGLNRTLQVLLDLVTLRMCTRFAAQPAHWFGILSLPFLALGVLFALAAFTEPVEGPAAAALAVGVFPSIAFLFFYLAFHLLTLGFLSELFLKVSDLKMTEVLDV